ncbi:MAG: hypothetical protein CM15mP121_1190 [Bacteroidota bacterium]|nr:MAG: hypothetical protein CM15mP121_1190 [Bacteroidota bacterium]
MSLCFQVKHVARDVLFTKTPAVVQRSGKQNKDGVEFSMSQWYPKLCEYDKEGWHANPYIGESFTGFGKL